MQNKSKQKKQIEAPNQREKIKKNASYPLTMEVQKTETTGRLCDTKKNLEKGRIINETKINKVKVNVSLIISI